MNNANTVTVLNLVTEDELTYVGLTPAQAVVAAYELYARKNGNTWTYDASNATQSKSGRTVICGDWCARAE